jgi:acyl dehydratase
MPVHFDHFYAAQTEFGRPLVDSTFTVALVTGQSVTDVSQNVFANLGWDEVRLPAPVFEGTPSTRGARSWRSASRARGRTWGSSLSRLPATTRTGRR